MERERPERADSLQPALARIVELETLYTHLQRTLGELDQVVLAQQRQIETLSQRIASLAGDLNRLAGSEPEVRKPEDERPPHY
jgi:uncharacterized coiled-coil protein SlyX